MDKMGKVGGKRGESRCIMVTVDIMDCGDGSDSP